MRNLKLPLVTLALTALLATGCSDTDDLTQSESDKQAAVSVGQVDAELKSEIKALATEMETAYVDNRAYPETLDALAAAYFEELSPTFDGDVLEVAVVNGVDDAFCIRASSPESSKDGSTEQAWFFYSSDGGGLSEERAGLCATKTGADFVDFTTGGAGPHVAETIDEEDLELLTPEGLQESQARKGVDAAVKSDIKALATALETTYVDNRAYPTDFTQLSDPVAVTGNGVIEVVVLNGASDAFCIRGSAPDGNYTGSDPENYFYYASDGGGLKVGEQAGLCATVADEDFVNITS